MTDHAKTTGKILCVSITIMLTVPGCSERRDSNPGPRKEKVRADAETEVTSSAGEDCGALPTIPTPEEAFAELRASSCVQYEWRRHRTDPWESFTIDSKEGRAHLARWLLEHEKKMEVCFDHRGGLSIQPSLRRAVRATNRDVWAYHVVDVVSVATLDWTLERGVSPESVADLVAKGFLLVGKHGEYTTLELPSLRGRAVNIEPLASIRLHFPEYELDMDSGSRGRGFRCCAIRRRLTIWIVPFVEIVGETYLPGSGAWSAGDLQSASI